MNPFTLDFSANKNEILDSLIQVFGKKFASLIKRRFELIYFVPYVNYDGINSYYRFLIGCKSKELSLKMLKLIGINVDKYDVTSYADDFSDELNEICNQLLGGSYSFETLFDDTPYGFRAFIDEYSYGYSDAYILEQKLLFINAVKSKDIDVITEDNYFEFVNTLEYKRIEALAFYYFEIYKKLLEEMKDYIETISEYKDYYKSELERKRKILEEQKLSLYYAIKNGLRGRIKTHIDSLDNIEDKVKTLLSGTLEHPFNIEYFNTQYEDMLQQDETPETTKAVIHSNRLRFFKNMGIDVDPWIDNYDEVIQRKDIKEFIVYDVFANEVTRLRKLYLEKTQEQFITEGKAYKDVLSYFGGSDSDKKAVYYILNNLQVCVSGGHNQKYDFIPIIYYTIRSWQCGCMDYVLLHEIIHAIQCVLLNNLNHSCGLEPNIEHPTWSKRQRICKKRKYERLNEVITDFLAIEVCEKLHKKDIYILDEKSLTLSNVDDFNTSKILKDSLRRFFIRFRKEIIEAGISGDITCLTDYVGEDNFEQLNDIVDHIDYLIGNGLCDKLKEQKEDDELVIEYRLLRKKLREVYKNMDIIYDERNNPYSGCFYKKRKVK